MQQGIPAFHSTEAGRSSGLPGCAAGSVAGGDADTLAPGADAASGSSTRDIVTSSMAPSSASFASVSGGSSPEGGVHGGIAAPAVGQAGRQLHEVRGGNNVWFLWLRGHCDGTLSGPAGEARVSTHTPAVLTRDTTGS